MTAVFAWGAAILAALSALFVVVLVVRRLQIARGERFEREEEERLRPLALMLVDGDAVVPATLGSRSGRVLAGLVARYGRWLDGDARVQIVAFFERSGGVAEELRALRDRRAWRRATAAYTLGDMGSPTAVPGLLEALDDPQRDVRAAAARSLGRLGAVEAVEPLVYGLAAGRVPRAVAGSALLATGSAALPALRELERRAEPEVRAFAVELVGLLGDASDGVLLIERLRDSSAETRAKAARALGRLGAREGASALREALSDRIPFVRACAAHALGEIGDRRAVPDLLRIARGDQHDAAHAAAAALARIDPDALRREAGTAPHLVEAADILAL